jgi:hypothetical protein
MLIAAAAVAYQKNASADAAVTVLASTPPRDVFTSH